MSRKMAVGTRVTSAGGARGPARGPAQTRSVGERDATYCRVTRRQESGRSGGKAGGKTGERTCATSGRREGAWYRLSGDGAAVEAAGAAGTAEGSVREAAGETVGAAGGVGRAAAWILGVGGIPHGGKGGAGLPLASSLGGKKSSGGGGQS